MQVTHKQRAAIEDAVRRWAKRCPRELAEIDRHEGFVLGVKRHDMPAAVVGVLEELQGLELADLPIGPTASTETIIDARLGT